MENYKRIVGIVYALLVAVILSLSMRAKSESFRDEMISADVDDSEILEVVQHICEGRKDFVKCVYSYLREYLGES